MRHVDKKRLAEFRSSGQCECCRVWHARREPHHVVAKGSGAGKRLDISLNLLALCGAFDNNCHDGIQGREEEGCRLVAKRECLDAAFVRERLWQLIRAPKTCHPCPSCWGAGSTLYECLSRPQVYRRQPCSLCAEGGILLPDGRPFVEAPRVFH